VLEAADGDEALRLARAGAVDLLLCDLLMPGRGGIETIRRLRREFPGLPVVVMTGGGCGGWVDLLPAARTLGAAGVLYKPFGPRDVLRAVARALRAPAAVAPPG
jgi:two-component system, chemotaxis family, chemotaxis protein CheY